MIDEGVDFTPENLNGNLLTGFDATDNDNRQQPNLRDDHTTACAGIIAAGGEIPAAPLFIAACGTLGVSEKIEILIF